jgi:hypothetical protein
LQCKLNGGTIQFQVVERVSSKTKNSYQALEIELASDDGRKLKKLVFFQSTFELDWIKQLLSN